MSFSMNELTGFFDRCMGNQSSIALTPDDVDAIGKFHKVFAASDAWKSDYATRDVPTSKHYQFFSANRISDQVGQQFGLDDAAVLELKTALQEHTEVVNLSHRMDMGAERISVLNDLDAATETIHSFLEAQGAENIGGAEHVQAGLILAIRSDEIDISEEFGTGNCMDNGSVAVEMAKTIKYMGGPDRAFTVETLSTDSQNEIKPAPIAHDMDMGGRN